MSKQTLYPSARYRDPRAAIQWLEGTLGFEREQVIEGDAERPIVHAELRGPDGAMFMLGTAPAEPDAYGGPGFGIYVAVEDPDALYERAVAAGAEIAAGPIDTDYGSRDFSVRDPEGNVWNFGTYRP
jgi:uncharacterized glyoxalase superfamily protein PhnB